MSLPSTFSNILIEGNTIDTGASNNGISTTAYTYSNNIVTSADCRIVDNYISGIQNSTINTFMILGGVAACNIRGNYFVRGTSNITAYIHNAGSTDMVIKDNFFDGYTPDGITNSIVTGLTANSIFTSNKNQVGYSVIPLGVDKSSNFQVGASPLQYELLNYSDFPPSTSFTNVMVTSGFGAIARDAYVLKIYNNEIAPTQQYFSMSIDISKSIPYGAKVIDAKISIFSPQAANALNTSGTNNFILGLNASRSQAAAIDVKDFFSASQISWMNGFSANGQLIVTSGNVANLSSNYQVIEVAALNFNGSITDSGGNTTTVVNTDISSNYVNGNDGNITATLNFSYKATAGSGLFPLLVVSPLIVTYVF